MNLTNQITGAVVRFMLFLPLLLLAMITTMGLCIDRLLDKRYGNALLELCFIPFKWLLLLELYVNHNAMLGITLGATNLVKTAPQRISHLIRVESGIDPNLYFSTKSFLSGSINHFEGRLFGSMTRRLILLLTPMEYIKNYLAHDENPHNPLQLDSMGLMIDLLQQNYADLATSNTTTIHNEILLFLENRAIRARTKSPGEQRSAQKALECLNDFTSHKHYSSAIDIKSAPSPLKTLYWVWLALHKETPAKLLPKLKKMLASYLGQIKTGDSLKFEQYDNSLQNHDRTECDTGAIGLLLNVVQAIPNTPYVPRPTSGELTDKVRSLLKLRLDSAFHENRFELEVGVQSIDGLYQSAIRPLFHYGRFLTQTPQGQRLAGGHLSVSDETILDMVETTLQVYDPPHIIRPRPSS